MMMRTVTLHRWQLLLALVLMTLSFVLAIGLVGREARHRTAENRELIEQVARISREHNQDRLAEQRTASDEAVNRCFSQAAMAPALRRALLAIENSIEDPVDRDTLSEFRRLSIESAPTLADCRQLARRLRVSIPKEFAQ
jgi:hypothetical protein